MDFTLIDSSQHALSQGSEAKAAAYICLRDNRSGKVDLWSWRQRQYYTGRFPGVFQRCRKLMEEK